MNVLLINGSPRKEGNTKQALQVMENVFKQAGLNPIHVQLGGTNIGGCKACSTCWKQKNKQCIVKDDLTSIMQQVFDDQTVGMVIGSPTYFSNMTTEVKAFIDRVGYVALANGGLLKGKIGTAAVICRRAGADFTYSGINYFFGINQMPIATSNYWNLGIAAKVGDIQNDPEGLKTFEQLALNMSNMIKKLSS